MPSNKTPLALRLCLAFLTELRTMLLWPHLATDISYSISCTSAAWETWCILSVSWQDFVCWIVTFRRCFGRQLLMLEGVYLQISSTYPLSLHVACKVKLAAQKITLPLYFLPPVLSQTVPFPMCFSSCRHFSHAFLDHLWKPASPSYLLCSVSGFLGTPWFVKYMNTWIMAPLAFKLNPFVDSIWSIHCSDN